MLDALPLITQTEQDLMTAAFMGGVAVCGLLTIVLDALWNALSRRLRTVRFVPSSTVEEPKELTPQQIAADKVLAEHIPGYDPETVKAMKALGDKLRQTSTRGASRNDKGQFQPADGRRKRL